MGQKIGLDTVIFIYLIERHHKFVDQARALLDGVKKGETEAVLSFVGVVELLTGPKKRGRFDLAQQYRGLISDIPNLTIYGITERVVEFASDMRAQYNLTTPDAIHIATAVDFGADKFITNDRNLKRVKEIEIELI